VDLIRHENHFNFIKMHYLSHLASHVRHFGSISIYSTEIDELAHKEQIKDVYRRSNKNEAARQILSQYGRQHALGMRLQTMEAVLKTAVIVVGNSGMEMPTSSSRSAPRRRLKGYRDIGTHSELCRDHEIEDCDMMEEMLRFIKQTAADDPQLPADPPNWVCFTYRDLPSLKFWFLTFRKLMSSRFTVPAALEQRLSATAVQETIWYGSRLAERGVIGIGKDGRWLDY